MIGAIIAVVAVVRAVMQSAEPNVWALAAAALAVAVALARPAALRPIHTVWMAFGRAMGWVNTRILLGLVFYLVLAPLGIAMRLAGRDPLRLRFDPDAATYAVPRRRRAGDHMRRLF